MRAATGFVGALRKSSVLKSSKKFTTITTSPGAKRTAARSIGSFAKALRLRSPGKKVLSAERWAKLPSFSKALKTKRQNTHFTARYTAQAASWVAWRPKVKSTGKRAQSCAPERFRRK